MTNTDQRIPTTAPASPPPSYVRRHPILAGFGILAGLSLFSALWPVSAIVVAVAVGGHATGLDRRAWTVTRGAATRVVAALRSHASERTGKPQPAGPPAPPQPVAPPHPSPPAPSREGHTPTAGAPRVRRAPLATSPGPRGPARSRHPRTPRPPVAPGVDGPGHHL